MGFYKTRESLKKDVSGLISGYGRTGRSLVASPFRTQKDHQSGGDFSVFWELRDQLELTLS